MAFQKQEKQVGAGRGTFVKTPAPSWDNTLASSVPGVLGSHGYQAELPPYHRDPRGGPRSRSGRGAGVWASTALGGGSVRTQMRWEGIRGVPCYRQGQVESPRAGSRERGTCPMSDPQAGTGTLPSWPFISRHPEGPGRRCVPSPFSSCQRPDSGHTHPSWEESSLMRVRSDGECEGQSHARLAHRTLGTLGPSARGTAGVPGVS